MSKDQMIRHRGLDGREEIVVSATPEQLTSVFDVDLWRGAAPGADERFDAARFGEWIEALVDVGEVHAARMVAALDRTLVVAGLSQYVRVFDPGIFEPTAQSDDEDQVVLVVTAEAGRTAEVGGYAVYARRADAWDAIVGLLNALSDEQPDAFHEVMNGCRRVSNSAPEIDGCDDLLEAPDQVMHDAAVEREHRRSQQGFSTPAAARAFLEMARQQRRRGSVGTAATAAAVATNPIVAAYFRALDEALASSPADTHARRSQELAFLANTLIAGCSIQSRAFTPQEAADAAVGICHLGIEHWPMSSTSTEAAPGAAGASDAPRMALTMRENVLLHYDLIAAFEVGWSVLYEEVCLFVADGLIAWATGQPALRRALLKQREAGTPWRARDVLDEIALIDMPAWISLLGLLDECPTIPAAVTAILEGRTGAVSATEFECISTRRQLDTIRAFMTRLPDILRA